MPAESEAVILALMMGEHNMIKSLRVSTDSESALVEAWTTSACHCFCL